MTESVKMRQLFFEAASNLKKCIAAALAGGDDPSVSSVAIEHLNRLEQEYRGLDEEKVRAFVFAMKNADSFPGISRRVVLARAQRFLWTLTAALEDRVDTLPAKSSREPSENNNASTPFDPELISLPGIGPKTASRLSSRGISSPLDLLFFLPTRYDDRRQITPIIELKEGERAVTSGEIKQVRVFGRPWKQIMEVIIEDRGARVAAVWFSNKRPRGERFVAGERLCISGLVSKYRSGLQIAHPSILSFGEPKSSESDSFSKRIVPVYREVSGVSNSTMEKAVRAAALRASEFVTDTMPSLFLERRGLLPLSDALKSVHLPPDDASFEQLNMWIKGNSPAHKRLIYDEFFFIQLALMIRKRQYRLVPSPVLTSLKDCADEISTLIGFMPTKAQRRVVDEISVDMAGDIPMQRLLQGDVGSGKTFVAACAMMQAVQNGYQAALMAPTEILAEQHMRTLYPLFKKMGIRIVLHLGNARSSVKKKNKDALQNRTAQIAVGTHALLQESVSFAKLGLAIVDEQHRFGVTQRLGLAGKSENGMTPHLLVMTATPIPRTLALTVHGDLDVSILDELPAGRSPVKTKLWSSRERDKALQIAEQALERGEQVFVVCPIIEESENIDVRAAQTVYEELSQRFLSHPVGLLHGRLVSEDKDLVMEKFVRGEIKLLVTTTVVEVGVDVPNASVMIVDGADRFGLAQLHQLRGRVGRSSIPSSCHLIADPQSAESWERLNVLERTNNGFEVAEADLAIRGPGELYGRRQAGLPGFKWGDLIRDAEILNQARSDAEELLFLEPELDGKFSLSLKEELTRRLSSDDSPVGEEAG